MRRKKKNIGNKLWADAKKIIPGGNMLLSKRPELYLPKLWPAYFQKAKKCYVWDIDGKKYCDMATMGVGTNILGYNDRTVNQAVIKSIKLGNMSSLNCKEEVELAKKLISMHKNFSMVKFAKTGGEANSIAVRIARAFIKKDNIAICGYHGWHDWYLAANLNSKKNLSKHLFPNLMTGGVPKKLKNTIFSFNYNDIQTFYKICKKNNIGIVKMEVCRNTFPKNNFLKKIRKFCTKNKIVLIFDECTSGFRETYGGLHLKYNVIPDMCILGKALGNGFPITAVLGKKNIMKKAKSTFISSTFWTERTGFVAALKTLDEMKKKKSWIKISKIGKEIKEKWEYLAKKNKISLSIFGIDALPGFIINSKRWQKYKSFITYEMLKKSFLFNNVVYVSIHHNKKILKRYFRILDSLMKKIYLFEKNQKLELLKNIPVGQFNLKRLN